MALYNNSAFAAPFNRPIKLNSTTPPQYLFGSFNSSTQPWLFQVTSVSLTANVATLGVTLRSGGGPSNIVLPTVGAKMGVQGTQTDSGVFNVDPTTVTAVDYDPATATGTISYALTGSDVATTADAGTLVVQPSETPDLVSEGDASVSYALWYGPDMADNSRSLYCEAKWGGTIPSAATVVLEVSNYPDDSRFATVQNNYGTSPSGTVASSDNLCTIADGAVTQSGANYTFCVGKFIRAKVLSMTGGDDTTSLIVTVFG